MTPLPPPPQRPAAHDAEVREQAGAFLSELGALAADLGREGVPQDAENKFSLFDAARLQELTDGLQEALGGRQAAFAEEAQRVNAAGAAVAEFRRALGEFSAGPPHPSPAARTHTPCCRARARPDPGPRPSTGEAGGGHDGDRGREGRPRPGASAPPPAAETLP